MVSQVPSANTTHLVGSLHTSLLTANFEIYFNIPSKYQSGVWLDAERRRR